MMNDTYVTVVGNVVAEPRQIVTTSGAQLVTFRLASTSRRFDREAGQWRDGDTLYISVSCWRSLAENVASSIRKGEPLVVAGRLRTRSYVNSEGHNRTVTEIEAAAVGHNLSRGVARFQKARRGHATAPPNASEPPANTWDGASSSYEAVASSPESVASSYETASTDAPSETAAREHESLTPLGVGSHVWEAGHDPFVAGNNTHEGEQPAA